MRICICVHAIVFGANSLWFEVSGRCIPVTGFVSAFVSLSVRVYVSSNLVSCINTRFLLGQMIQMICSEPANRAD